jgi:site-specific recombinase XerD
MTDLMKLGPWIRRFLLEHLIKERNLSRGTQRSYRDTLTLLIPFVARKTHRRIDELDVLHVSSDLVRMFLLDLEENRDSAISTRNQRLAAIHSLARFVALHSPEHIAWCQQICVIPFTKGTQTPAVYLEKAEIDALLAAPNLKTAQGQRDHLLLLFLYNTGARADEAAQVLVGDLNLAHVPSRDFSWVKIRGKGNKLRHCPLWPQTVNKLAAAIEGRAPTERVFLNRYGRPVTRFGVYDLVTRYVRRTVRERPSLATKDVSPHTMRHSTATHLLRSGVDINTVRDWLGHVSIDTTNIYTQVDLETKAKAIARCEPGPTKPAKHWSHDKGLMTFLRSL